MAKTGRTGLPELVVFKVEPLKGKCGRMEFIWI